MELSKIEHFVKNFITDLNYGIFIEGVSNRGEGSNDTPIETFCYSLLFSYGGFSCADEYDYEDDKYWKHSISKFLLDRGVAYDWAGAKRLSKFKTLEDYVGEKHRVTLDFYTALEKHKGVVRLDFLFDYIYFTEQSSNLEVHASASKPNNSIILLS